MNPIKFFQILFSKVQNFFCTAIVGFVILSQGLISNGAFAQGYTPVATTGYNFDAIAETFPNAVATTTGAMDLSNFVLYSQAFGTAAGFGAGIINTGTIVNGTNTYQLMPFNGNNALRLVAGNNTGTLTLTTPASFAQLSLLGFATEGNSNIQIVANYTDGTSNTLGPVALNDWFFAAGFATSGHGRISRVAAAPYNMGGTPGNPRMYPINLNIPCASQQKLVSSVTITQNSGGNINTFIMALSGVSAPNMTAPSNQSVCAGQSTSAVNFSGTAGTTYTWTNNNTAIGLGASGNGNIPVFTATNNTGAPITATITVTPTFAGCPGTPQTFTITVTPGDIPTFTPLGTFCSGATIPPLPTTSNNGIAGTWSPALNNLATTTYTFTPTNSQCTSSVQMTITIGVSIQPTFTQVGPFCSGATIPALPTTSNNGVTGAWSPVLNNSATTTYTFNPLPGQCANPVQMTITINPSVTPTFAAQGPFCSGATIPALPTTSQNGVTGTWSPAINNTATTTYTFNPAANQCSNSVQTTITITPNVTPTFAAQGPFCSGATIPALPTTSQNGISGTWNLPVNNTATTTYTFTPTAGQCANTSQLTITINPILTPTFAAQGPFCSGATIPVLPTTSQNGVTGTWNLPVNNTNTTTYIFFPSVGQCAVSSQMTITINPNVTPTFSAQGPYCSGTTIPALPAVSTNGVSGTWSPQLNNTQTTVYTFNPEFGACATNVTTTVVINNPSQSVTQLSVCANETPYMWNGLLLNSSGQYQATLTNAVGCDSTAIMNFSVIEVPMTIVNLEICENQTPFEWNGLTLTQTGSSVISLATSIGCDSLVTLNLLVRPLPQVNFSSVSSVGCAPILVEFSNLSGVSGTCQWNLGNGTIINSCDAVSAIYAIEGCYDVSLRITDAFGCTNSLTQNDLICVEPKPVAQFIVAQEGLTAINPVAHFTNTSIGNSSQVWSFGNGFGTSTQNHPSFIYPEQYGQYMVTLVVANGNGCIDSTSQLVVVQNVVLAYVPNTFTPDGDLYNETFTPMFTAGFDIYRYNMKIFNRWGEIVFESQNAAVGWDGTYGGVICQQGTYVWQISYKEIGVDKMNIINGHVNLLR